MGRVVRRSFALLAVVALLTSAAPSVGARSLAAASTAPAVQRGEYDSYIVLMKADPLVVSEGRALATPKAKDRGHAMAASHDQVLRNAGISGGTKVSDYVNTLNGFSALVTYDQALRIAADPTVAVVLPDELLQPQTDSSPEFIGLTGRGEAWTTGLTGRGVVVGVIDTGIWPEHPSFADHGLPAPPTGPLPCEFGNTAHNVLDAPFTCNKKLIGARQMLETYRELIGADPDEFDSARDDNGHGTHTASTAAGDAGVEATILGEKIATVSGIAPDAHIIAYKGLGNLGGFTSDLAAAIDQAVEDGVDVINYSIGGGGTALTGDELSFLFAAGVGVHVATSAGNSGPGDATIGNPAKVPWVTTVGANTQRRFFAGTVELGNGKSYEGASITAGTDGFHPLVDAADAGDEFCQSSPGLDKAVATGAIVLCKRGVNARLDKSLAVKEAGGVGMIMYEANDQGNLFTDTHWVPSVHVDNTPGLAIKAYIADAGEGATAEIRDTRSVSTWESAPSMTSFSSRGPNIYGDIIKPDITAPGMQILAGNTPFPDPGTLPGELFQAIAGTSMSSPHVAGLYALLAQAHPDWSPAAARSALMTTADTKVVDNDRKSQATPFEMGAGMVDPGRVNEEGTAFQPGLVYDAGFNDYLSFLCEAFPAVFNDPKGTCSALVAAGYSTDPSDLNYPSIGVAALPGTQTIRRTVTSVATDSAARTYRVSVEQPDGYDVSVTPSTITLRRGQSATFEVTIVNESAPLSEWRFGSLTWTSGARRGANYEVRSQIAVRGSALNAPEHVSGTGETGSATIDVSFGYTGDYEAVARGLVPATLTEANVLQDPDQEFAPSDVGNGANVHEFALSGAGVFRIALPPEATEAEADLDVYVFDPSGQEVAESASGGTDELITIDDPADGTWKVYVHGWATPGGDSDYTLYTWAIPGTSAGPGSLVVASAPDAATLGTIGTVEVSWTGATAGQWHFGAVSHLGDGGAFLGRTLVEVDNRTP